MLVLWLLSIFTIGVRCELDQSNFGLNINSENETWKDINLDHNHRHRIKESSYVLDRYSLVDLPQVPKYCPISAKCEPLRHNTCMGVRLPYEATTLDLLPQTYSTQEAVREKLHTLQALKYIPKCWAVVQPLLCSVFTPKCVNNTVHLPSQDTCKRVATACRIIFNETIWPNFFKCEDNGLFPEKCENDILKLKFNTSWKCPKPLVPSDHSLSYLEGLENCGVPCDSPLYTSDEHKQIHSFVAWAAGSCCFFNLFTMVTFLIDWRSTSKYPAVVIFYINCCYMVSCIGWLVQFSPGSREVIICRKDGTLRMSEPSGENLSCVVVFVLVYYSSMAAMAWFAILTYSWHMSFQALDKIQDRIDKKGAYFHLIAWCLPLMFTVTIMALGEIDGNSMTGICFVGYENQIFRVWFLLVPVFVTLMVGGYFLTRGLITLIRLKISSQEIISERASSKIRETIVRMGLFSVFTFVAVLVTFYCHIYEFQHSSEWKQNFKKFIICSIATKYAESSECKMDSRPSAAKLQLHLLSPFFAGILMSSWVWTGSTVDTWIRFLRRTFNCEAEEPIKLKKHKVIAQAFAKRKTFNNAGRLSISFHNTHEDPVGLNFDLNSVASQDFSSTWAAALPKLVTRRGALVGGGTGSVSSNRRNSADSEYSFSVRRVSVESRRNSLDSHLALSMTEIKTTARVKNNKRRKSGKRRRDFDRSKHGKVVSQIRRGSTTSQESQLGAQILSALSIGGAPNIGALQVPNMKRRSACAGLDERMLNSKNKDAESFFPSLFPGQSDSDENLSSEEKRNGKLDKDIDLENGIVQKIGLDTDSEDSNADEDTKMLALEEPMERSKSKNSNNSFNRDNERHSRSSKYIMQDETVLKHLLHDSDQVKQTNDIKSDLTSLNSYCPELTRIIQTDSQMNAREIATQTSLPLDILEMEELKQSIDDIINSRNCSSKGTQISALPKKCKK